MADDSGLALNIPINAVLDGFNNAMKGVQDSVSGAMGGIKSKLGEVQEAFGAVGLLAGNYLKGAVDSAAKAQQSTTQLQGLLKNQGVAFQDTTKDITAFTGGITKMSTYSAGEAKNALINLTEKGMKYSDSLKSQNALANLAAGSNMDLSSASNLLAQAYNGRYMQLERLGIVTKEQVKDGITYQQVLDAINQRFSGAAAAQVNTYAGQMKILSNNMAAMKTAIGTALLPVLTQLMEQINKILSPMIDFVKAHAQLAAAILATTTAVGTLVGGFAIFSKISSILGPAVSGIVELIGGLSLPIAGIIAAIGALVYAYTQNFGGLKTFLDGVFKTISNLFKTFTGDIKSGLSPIASIEDVVGKAFGAKTQGQVSNFISNAILLFNNIKNTAKQVWPTIQSAITSVFQVVAQLWNSVLKPIFPIILQVMQSLLSWVISHWPQISATIGDVFKGIQVIWVNVLRPVLTLIIQVMGQLVQWISANWPLISNTISIVFNTIMGVIKGGLSIIQGIWSTVWPYLRDIVGTVWNVIKDTVSTAIKAVEDIITLIMDVINGNWGKAWQDIVSLVKDVFGGVGKIIGDILNGIGKIFEDMGHTAMQWGKDLIDNLITGIENAVPGLSTAVSGIASVISSMLHHSVPDKGPLKDDDLWMGDMMDNFTKGITSNKYKITNAIKGLATDMNVGIKYNTMPAINNTLQNTTQASAPQSQTGNNPNINLSMNVDGKTWAQASLKYTELTQGRNNKFTARRLGVTNG